MRERIWRIENQCEYKNQFVARAKQGASWNLHVDYGDRRASGGLDIDVLLRPISPQVPAKVRRSRFS
jgi:hypothetical protein